MSVMADVQQQAAKSSNMRKPMTGEAVTMHGGYSHRVGRCKAVHCRVLDDSLGVDSIWKYCSDNLSKAGQPPTFRTLQFM